MTARSDIASFADVSTLIDAFYTAVRPDPVLGHFFVDLDWDTHIPRIASFWNMVLFGDRSYQGDPMTAHIHLHRRIPMSSSHFARWLQLFESTVDELFTGPKAEEVKQRARTIAGLMEHKVSTSR